MGTQHNAIVNGIILELGRKYPNYLRVWPNNTGALRDEHGRLVRFGLVGSADIFGVVKNGPFFAIEVKSGRDQQREAQKNFQTMIEAMGHVYVLARSIEEGVAILEEAIILALEGKK
jgi:hypothetical protein